MFDSSQCADPAAAFAGLTVAIAELPAPVVDSGPMAAGLELQALLVLQRRLQAQVVERVASFDAHGFATAYGAASTQAWIQSYAALDPGQAASLVGSAKLIRALPQVGDKLARGEIGVEHVAALQRATRHVPETVLASHDTVLARLAESAHPRDLARAGEKITEVWQHDLIAHDPAAALQVRRLTLAQTIDGIWQVDGQLTAEDGAKLAAVLEPLMRKRGPEDERTPVQRRADALLEVVDIVLRSSELPQSGGDRTRLTLLVHLTDMALLATEGPAAPTEDVEGPSPVTELKPSALFAGSRVAAIFGNNAARQLLGSHLGLTADALTRIACDADVNLSVINVNGDPLYQGRTTRFPSVALMRALVVRDGGCVFPGCDRLPSHCQAHHLIFWSNLGRTDIDNLALVCGFHHMLIHDHHWQLERLPVSGATPHGGWVATAPHGLVLRRHRQPAA